MKATIGLRLEELRQQRMLLIERADLQRGELGRAFEELGRPFHLVNLGLVAAHWIKSNPKIAGVSAAGAAMIFGKLRGWVGRAIMAWELLKVIRRHLPQRHEADVNDAATT